MKVILLKLHVSVDKEMSKLIWSQNAKKLNIEDNAKGDEKILENAIKVLKKYHYLSQLVN